MAERSVNVTVVLGPPGSNPPFHFESSDLPIGPNNVIYFANCGKSKGFLITYTIDDRANPGYLFPTHGHGNDHLDQALWVSDTGPCPTKACYWESVFKARSVDNGGQSLVVWNKNAVVQNFAYTLRVVNGANWLNLDPGGSNQNGGLPFYKSLSATMLTGAVAALGTFATITRGFEPTSAVGFVIGGALVGLIVGFLLERT